MKPLIVFSFACLALASPIYAGPPKFEDFMTISVVKESTFKAIFRPFSPAIPIFWGKVVDKGAPHDWENPLQKLYFMATEPNIEFSQWKAAFSEDRFENEEAAQNTFKNIKERFPTSSAFQSSVPGIAAKNQWVHGEVWLLDGSKTQYCFIIVSNNKTPSNEEGSVQAFVLEGDNLRFASSTAIDEVTNVEGFGKVPIALKNRIQAIVRSRKATVASDGFLAPFNR